MDYGGPTGEGPEGWVVNVIEPPESGRLYYQTQGRDPGPGPFHVLRHHGVLWMSDTRAEKMDHYTVVRRISLFPKPAKVLIHGLGMGLVTAAALRLGAHVDVVEIDQDLIDWQLPWLDELAEERHGFLATHQGDALTYRWGPNTRWNVVWHDIWRDISEDNLDEMKYLHRSFGRRTDWQGSWARDWIIRR